MATLSVSFTPPATPPANGYRVKYWLASDPSNIFTVSPNPTSSPVTITGLTGSFYQGTIEADCGGGLYSSLNNFSASIITGDPCLSGTTLATANCSSGQTSIFTVATGYSVKVSLSGFYYSGTGTRTITGSLLNNSNGVIQNFTYTQTGSAVGTTSPSFYTLVNNSGSSVSYKLQINTVNCSNGSGTGSMTVGNCVSTGATYTSIGTTNRVGATTCTSIGTTPELFLDAADYAIYTLNGGCISDGFNTVAVLRDSTGTPISGTFYFTWYGGSCSYTTFKSTNGNVTINATQC